MRTAFRTWTAGVLCAVLAVCSIPECVMADDGTPYPFPETEEGVEEISSFISDDTAGEWTGEPAESPLEETDLTDPWTGETEKDPGDVPADSWIIEDPDESEAIPEEETEQDPVAETEMDMLSAAEVTDTAQSVPLDEAHFPDPYFRKDVTAKFDTDQDGVLSADEIGAAKSLNGMYGQFVESLQGIEYLTALRELDYSCHVASGREGDGKLESVDLSANTALTKLSLYCHQLKSVDLSANKNLTSVDLQRNDITELRFGQNSALGTLNVSMNEITSLDDLDLDEVANLHWLYMGDNYLTDLDLSALPCLYYLDCSQNRLTSLDLSSQGSLSTLSCGNNGISELDLSPVGNLNSLDCGSTQIRRLDLGNVPRLMHLSCANTPLESVPDFSRTPMLWNLDCSNCGFTSLDVSVLPELMRLYCSGNSLSEIDLTNNPKLEILKLERNRIAAFDFSQNSKLTANNVTISPQFLTAKAVKKGSGYTIDTAQLGTTAADLTVSGVIPAQAAPAAVAGGIVTCAAAPDRVVLQGSVTSGTLTALPVSLIVNVEQVVDESGHEVLPEDDTVSVGTAEIGLGKADYIFPVEDGYETVTWNTKDRSYFVVERYDGAKQFLRGKRVNTSHLKLSADQKADDIKWGGAFEGEKYNFIVTGQTNNSQDDNRPVVLVAKFSKDWVFLGSCPVCNNSDLNGIGSIEATSVFDSGPVRMSELDGDLWVVSNHTGYTLEDGHRHFGKMSLVVDEETMDLKGTAERYSHDFDCYVVRVNDEMYCMDLVEGSRNVVVGRMDLSRYNGDWSGGASESVVIYDFWTRERDGAWSYPLYGYTGGLEYSEISDRLLAVGAGYDQEKLTANGGDAGSMSSNIWLRLVSPDLKTVEKVSLTSYPDSKRIDASAPRILKMDSNRFLLTWQEWDYITYEFSRKFMFIDGSGNSLTDPVVLPSESDPSKMILAPDGTAVWVDPNVPGGIASIDPADFAENGHAVYLTFDANGGVLPAEGSLPEADGRTVRYWYEKDGSGDPWIYPTPVRKSGKATIFAGWYTDPYYGVKVDGEKLSAYRQTLYAWWKMPPAPPEILSARVTGVKAKAKKRKVTVSWKKPSSGDMRRYGITGIEIQVSTDKNFTVLYKSKNLGKTKKSWKFKGKKKTTYYVRVRYLGNEGESRWSKTAKVRIKK